MEENSSVGAGCVHFGRASNISTLPIEVACIGCYSAYHHWSCITVLKIHESASGPQWFLSAPRKHVGPCREYTRIARFLLGSVFTVGDDLPSISPGQQEGSSTTALPSVGAFQICVLSSYTGAAGFKPAPRNSSDRSDCRIPPVRRASGFRCRDAGSCAPLATRLARLV